MTTVTLSPLRPYARLIKMSDGAVVATTSVLLAGSGRQMRMDAASGLTVVVPLSDPGDGTDAGSSFAAALLSAGGGPGAGTPVPMLLSLSLDGGTSYDSHRLVQKPLRDMAPDRLTLTESGGDIWEEYGKIPAGGGRATLAGCSLADVLGAAPGTIIPLAGYTGFISSSGAVPFLSGLLYPVASVFQDIPGNTASWNSGALARLRFVAVLPTQGFTTAADLAFTLPTDMDTWADTQQHAIAVLVERLGAVVLSGDTAPLGSRGHYVADCSDHALNASGAITGVVADGTPTSSTLPGTGGYSNARLVTPPAAPTLSAVTATSPGAGAWTVGLTYVTAAGETNAAHTAAQTVTGSQAVHVAALSSIPAGITQVKYYMSTVVGNTTLGYVTAQNVVAGAVGAINLTVAGNGSQLAPATNTAADGVGGLHAGVPRSVLIGAVGTSSVLHFTDTPSASIIDETAEALILSAQASVEPEQTILYGGASFDGGASDAGFPAGGHITALTQVNRSAGDDAWSTCLPIVGINVSDQGGGVYYWDTLGRLVPLNKSQSLAVFALMVDTVNGVINIATQHGVYHRTVDITDTTAAWTNVGGLTARVVRLAMPVVEGVAYLYAQVSDPQNRQLDGIYLYLPLSSTPGLGYNGWVRRLATPNLLEDGAGFTATDEHSFFYIDKSDQNGVFLRDETATPTLRKLPLPAGVNAIRLDRVTGDPADTVYITVSDGSVGIDGSGPQCAYYTVYDSGTWQDPVPTWLVPGQSLQVNRFVGPLKTINGVNAVQVIACTGNGLYYATTNTPSSADDWHSMNDQSGLSGINITDVSAGAAQTVLGQTMNRVYATTAEDLYQSSNGGIQFDNVTHGRVDYGPVFFDMLQQTTGAPPTNSVRTIGPMSSSPIGGGAGTHVQVTTYHDFATFPTGGYLERRLTQRGAWEWRVWNSTCPYAALQKDQLSDIVADETQDALTASAISVAVTKKWLWQASTPQTILSLPSFFTQTGAKLRTLQPGQLVHVTLTGTIPQRSSTGDIIATVWVDFEGASFYVLDHQWQLPSPGNSYASTVTRLGTVFRDKPLSPQDMATAFQRQLSDLKVRGAGRRR